MFGVGDEKSSSSTEIEYNEEGRCSKENANNIKNTQVEENCLADDLFGKNQASPSDCEKKMSEEKCKGDGETPRFKRKLSYVSSSQPICKNDLESSITSQDIEILTSIRSGSELRKSSSSTEIKLNEEGLYSKENADNIKNKQVEENCLADLSGKNQASSSDCDVK